MSTANKGIQAFYLKYTFKEEKLFPFLFVCYLQIVQSPVKMAFVSSFQVILLARKDTMVSIVVQVSECLYYLTCRTNNNKFFFNNIDMQDDLFSYWSHTG